MSRLTNIGRSSSGNPKRVAKLIGANDSFQRLCEILIVRAYTALITKRLYKPEWVEDTFSANFQVVIDAICIEEGIPMNIVYQEPQLTEDILSGTTSPTAAKRMDLVFSQFAFRERLKYGVEAKIVVSANTQSRNAKRLSQEYVTSGMDRFINGSYEMDGCMVGYVISGNAHDTLALINSYMTGCGRETEILQDQHTIQLHATCYQSRHENCKLKHLLFVFT